MPDTYGLILLALSGLILLGIRLMGSPRTAVRGNMLAALSMFAAVMLVLYTNGIVEVPLLWAAVATGAVIGYFLAVKVTMLKMPQVVALFNGCGGGASAMVALVEIMERAAVMDTFTRSASQLALVIGCFTLGGSLIAAAKLDGRISQRPVVIPGYKAVTGIMLTISLLLVLLFAANALPQYVLLMSGIVLGLALLLGVFFALRVGGADMPITISLLNSFSGLAGAITGFTVSEPLLVAVGAIVGASGLILTRIMCSAMNRSLGDVLTGASLLRNQTQDKQPCAEIKSGETGKSPAVMLKDAKKVIIVPGYGLAVAQAQSHVKKIMDLLEKRGVEVKFAIHPVAGRMPGHMNVLLAEADVPYDKLFEMDEINPEFKDADAVLVVGACDVVNPAANTAEGTPIYGMPVLKVEEAKAVVVCNLDTRPGYSGVENPLYNMPHVCMLTGDATATLEGLTAGIKDDAASEVKKDSGASPGMLLKDAKKVIIVPGYGLAVAQAQSHVKKIMDLLEKRGVEVKFAIHPVAGRMPGHMNVLLAEADVPYDKLFEMDEINAEFKDADAVLVVGACDVVNPAANTAEGTPIYGMPVLKVEEAKAVVVCNLDTRPGYSGVDNPLYDMPHACMLTGDAAATLEEIISKLEDK